MRTFSVGSGRIQSLAYTPDSRSLLVDLRHEPQSHPCMGFTVHPATEIIWYDILSETATRRFRLRDSLYGPGGFVSTVVEEEQRPDPNPNKPALDVSLCLAPLWVATVWEWTNKEDGVCVFDVERSQTVDLRTPYKTHTQHIRLSPNGSKLLAATVNDMDGSALFEVWDLARQSTGELQSGESWWDQMMRERHTAMRRGCANPFPSLAALAFDGRFLAAISGGTSVLLVWDSLTVPADESAVHVDVRELDWSVGPQEGLEVNIGFAPQCLGFAPAGSLVAAAGAGLALFDPLTSSCRSWDRPGATILAVAFSPDGRELVCGTESGAVEHWSCASGRLLRALEWGCGPISAVAVAPDGDTCAAGTESGHIVVWDRTGD
jgi:WD40 repeat protein